MADPVLAPARRGIDLVLKVHEPYPALAVDRHWLLVAANAAVTPMFGMANAELLQPPSNVLRLSLHPRGLAPQIANLAEWRAHLLSRLRRQVETTADPALADLLRELSEYPAPVDGSESLNHHDHADIVVPLKLRTPRGILSFFGTITIYTVLAARK